MRNFIGLIVFTFLLLISPSAFAQSNTLNFSTLIGGNGVDYIRDVATDSQGNIYVTGGTASTDYPTTAGAYDRTFDNGSCPTLGSGGQMDIFVTKLNPSGQIIWSTYLGGPCYDRAYGIEVDSLGYVYITGRAGRNFPTTAGVPQPTFLGSTASLYGDQNAFIAKLAPDGSQLIFSTYFGTAHANRDLAIDQNGDIFVATHATTPLTSSWFTNAYQKTINGTNDDSVVAKIKSDGTQVLWATYFGGTGIEGGTPSIRLDSVGNPIILSGTNSTNLPFPPTSQTVYDRSFNGVWDMFVAKFSSDGSSLLFSTYLGGADNEFTETHGLAVDSQNNVMVAVTTISTNMPIVGGIQSVYGGSGGAGTGSGSNYPGDGYVAKLSSDGSQLLASTYYGGRFGEGIEGVGTDLQGNVYFSGATYSDNLTTTTDGRQRTIGGDADFFAVKMSTSLNQILYATYLGGSLTDFNRTSIADGAGNFYIAGHTRSTNFPLLNPLYPTHKGGIEDAVLAKFNLSNQAVTITPPLSSPTPGGSATVRFYSLSGDGRVDYFGPQNSGCGQSQWDTAFNTLTAGVDYTSAIRSNFSSTGCGGVNAVNLTRGFLPFDTSTLPDNAVITDATLNLYINGKTNNIDDGNDFITVVQGLQSSPLLLSDTDFTKAGNSLINPIEGSNRSDITSLPTASYATWNLNPTGISWINKAGYTQLALREGHDILNIWGGYGGGQVNGISVYLSEQTGTAQDPYLEVTYTTQTHCPPLGNIDCNGVVSATDLSYLISKFGGNDQQVDLNDSGRVNAVDLAILLSNFGQ